MERIKPYLKRDQNMSAPAGGLVQSLLMMLGFDPKMYAAFEIWDRETKGLVRGCEAVAIRGSRLCVRVPSAMHRQELLYSKNRILDKLNQALGQKLIKDIEFELKAGTETKTQPPAGAKGGFLREQIKDRIGIDRGRKISG